jgi:hypothetical protein
MWVCGILGVNFGHDNILDNNSILEYIQKLDPLEMNIQFLRMLFFVAKLWAEKQDHCYENDV